MSVIFRSTLVAAFLAAMPVASVWAQPANSFTGAPVNSPEAGSGKVSKPTYPTGGKDIDPALDGIRPAAGTAQPQPFGNPRVPGATGETVMQGNNSTISGDRAGTIDQKTGATSR